MTSNIESFAGGFNTVQLESIAVNDTGNATSEPSSVEQQRDRNTTSPVVAACIYTGLLPEPRGKFRLRLQFCHACLACNSTEQFQDQVVGDRANLKEEGQGKPLSREGGCKVDKWLSPGTRYDGKPLQCGAENRKENPAVNSFNPYTTQLPTFLGPPNLAAEPPSVVQQ